MQNLTASSSGKLDDLGRVVIPRKLRDAFGWREGDRLTLQADPDGSPTVLIRQDRPRCSFCREDTQPLHPVGVGLICAECLLLAADLAQTVSQP